MHDTQKRSGPVGRTFRLRRILAAIGSVCLLAAATVALEAPAAHAAGTDYYVDCSASANGDGTQGSPWNTLNSVNSHEFGPGDHIRLRAGTSCSGYLQASGSGAPGLPITVTSYGTGAAPTINNNGAQFKNQPNQQSCPAAGSGRLLDFPESAAVVLQNVSHWTIENIAVTNNAPEPGVNSGVLVGATDNNTYSGITINAVDVSNVNGILDRYAAGRYSSAGILVQSPDKGCNLSGHFDHVTISNNTVHDVKSMGVAIVGGDGHDAKEHNTNVLVKGNTITRPGDDAILVGVSQSPMTEYNISREAGWNNPKIGNIAAIWTYTSSDPTFQYNEAVATQPAGDKEDSGDSQAWDCDWGVTGTCLYQYNYSNSNAGGFFLDCAGCVGSSTDPTIILRHNVSQNEGRVFAPGSTAKVQMYNNTFDAPNRKFTLAVPDGTEVQNNIFVGSGLTKELPTTSKFNNNLWWGFSAPSNDTHAISKDPLLVEDSAGGYGTGTNGGTTMGETSGFQLSTGSPALASGVLIPTNNDGINGGKDFWGNPVSATAVPNIGAYNGPAQAQRWTKFNDDSPQFAYDDSWGHLTGRSFGDHQGDVHYTKTDNASVTFTFHGTGVKVLTETYSDEGAVKYSLDGSPVQFGYDATVSAPARRAQVPVFTWTGLDPNKQHTLTLSKASGTYLVIDRIDVTG
jgi:hypothetical protein